MKTLYLLVLTLLAVSTLARETGSTSAASTDSSKPSKKDKCYALALSGGGSKGAYEAGVLWGMYYAAKDKREYQYDVVSGVSAGAINSGAIQLFAPGDEENMLEFLSMSWQTMNNSGVFKQWYPLGPVTGLVEKSGILDDSPLMGYIDTIFDQFHNVSKRMMAVSCVDAVTGGYITFNETNKDKVKAIVSSASIPFLFPSQKWEEEGWVCMDGGSVWNTNLVTAIERCRSVVEDDSQIVLDIVICGAASLNAANVSSNAVLNLERYRTIKNYHNDLSDILEFQKAFPEVQFRHFVQPAEPLKGNGRNEINFSNDTCTYEMQLQGREDGELAISQGPFFYAEKFQSWQEDPDLRASWSNSFDQYIHSIVIEEHEKFINS